MDQVDDVLEDRRVRLGEHPVSEVEDVTGMVGVASQDVGNRRVDDPDRGEADGGVEVALEDGVLAEPLAGNVKGDAPVDTDAISGRISPVPTPKWILGTPRSATSSNTRRLAGSTYFS